MFWLKRPATSPISLLLFSNVCSRQSLPPSPSAPPPNVDACFRAASLSLSGPPSSTIPSPAGLGTQTAGCLFSVVSISPVVLLSTSHLELPLWPTPSCWGSAVVTELTNSITVPTTSPMSSSEPSSSGSVGSDSTVVVLSAAISEPPWPALLPISRLPSAVLHG